MKTKQDGKNVYTNREKIDFFTAKIKYYVRRIKELEQLDPDEYQDDQDWTETVSAYIKGRSKNR